MGPITVSPSVKEAEDKKLPFESPSRSTFSSISHATNAISGTKESCIIAPINAAVFEKTPTSKQLFSQLIHEMLSKDKKNAISRPLERTLLDASTAKKLHEIVSLIATDCLNKLSANQGDLTKEVVSRLNSLNNPCNSHLTYGIYCSALLAAVAAGTGAFGGVLSYLQHDMQSLKDSFVILSSGGLVSGLILAAAKYVTPLANLLKKDGDSVDREIVLQNVQSEITNGLTESKYNIPLRNAYRASVQEFGLAPN